MSIGTNLVMANLVMGSDGSTTLEGSSKTLSSPQDRLRFHELRAQASAILIGGNTARNEPYATTPLPLVVISRTGNIPESVLANPLLHLWQLDPVSAIQRARTEFGENIYDLSALTRNFTVESSEKFGDETLLKLIRN